MLVLELGDFGHARIWIDDPPPEISCEIANVAARLLPAEKPSAIGRKAIALEVAWHVGGMIRYGVLGAEWRPEETGGFSLRMPVSAPNGPQWTDSIASDYDDVEVGLPEEYLAYAIEGFEEAAVLLGQGELAVTHAAHGMVGSSPSMFRQLGHALVRMLFLSSPEPAKLYEIVISSLNPSAATS